MSKDLDYIDIDLDNTDNIKNGQPDTNIKEPVLSSTAEFEDEKKYEDINESGNIKNNDDINKSESGQYNDDTKESYNIKNNNGIDKFENGQYNGNIKKSDIEQYNDNIKKSNIEQYNNDIKRPDNEIENDCDIDDEDIAKISSRHQENKRRMIIREIISYIFIVAAAFTLAILSNTYLIVNARIPSGSMIPTITEGNRIIGNRLAYINSEPKRGDIVVFYYPDDESQKFIKRIIGLPGETIYIADGIVYIDGQPLDESAYLTVETYGVSGPFTIPDDCYFMMGDNRNSSNDSRFWTNHFVHKDKIIAKALFCYYPSIHLIK